MDRIELADAYWNALLIDGERPKSVYAFMHSLKLAEEGFYTHFASFHKIESIFWQATVNETVAVLEADEDFPDYPADQKLLAFFFTYITHIQKNRSRFVDYFPKSMSQAKPLMAMKESFEEFIKPLIGQAVQEGIFADRKKMLDSYPRFIWGHFMAVIRFYLQDSTDEFQATDAFIEKSVKLGIHTAAPGVLDAGVDLVRFMVGQDDRLKGVGKLLSRFIPEK